MKEPGLWFTPLRVDIFYQALPDSFSRSAAS